MAPSVKEEDVKCFIHKVEEGVEGKDGALTTGAVYRSIYAKDGMCPLPEGMYTTWDTFT